MVVPTEKKRLRSCVRCRKNKTKCDSLITRPDPCSSCVKKGVECHVDYMSPPQRSREMKVLFDNIRYAKEKITSLGAAYDKLLEEVDVGKDDVDFKKMKNSTRILKILDKFYLFIIDENAGSFYVNNFRVDLSFVKASFEHFRRLIWKTLEIYLKWEDVSDIEREELKEFVSGFDVNYVVENNQLLLLICILNFYFDIPGLNYLEIYDHVVDSYCEGASKNGACSAGLLSRTLLAKLIVGDSFNWHFHSEMFIKHFTVFLFLNVVLYGPQYFMGCFMDRYIRVLESLRKKINFDKNWEVKWVNFYIRLLNLVENNAKLEGASYGDESAFEGMLMEVCEKVDFLSSFICLIKVDQHLIERRKWPFDSLSKKAVQKICDRLDGDLTMEVGTERPSFLEIFFSQLLSLNRLLCLNNNLVCKMTENKMNGFNNDLGVRVGDKEINSPYWCQAEFNFLLKYEKSSPDYAMKLAGAVIGKHVCTLRDESFVDVVKNDLDAYRNQEDMSLRILKSSCLLIWLLYEHAVYYEMLNRVLYYVPFQWNAQLLLENNGLVCESDDQRCKVVNQPSGAGIDQILDRVDWMKESADDVLRKIHGVLD